jgi:putative endopeptidase
MNTIQNSRNIAKEIVTQIDELRNNKTNLWKLLALINKNEMISFSCPFSWSIASDEKESDIYRCYINSPTFSILDLNVYYDDNTEVEYKKNYRLAFTNFVKKLFNTVFGKNHGFKPEAIFEIEAELFITLGCTNVSVQEESTYNKVSSEDAMKKYGFNWKDFSKELGFKTPPKFFIASSLNYLKCCTDLLIENWTTEKWRTYWVWLFIKNIARLTRDWEKVIYDFFGKYQRGQESIVNSDAVSVSLYMSLPFNNFLTNEYINKYQIPGTIEYVNTFCEDLKIVFEKIIKKNTWLNPSTKKYALLKLQHLKFIIGKPDKILLDPDLSYTNNFYENMLNLMTWRHNKFIGLEGEHIIDMPIMSWSEYPAKMIGSQAYIVNASYTPSRNSIYINQGYIQKPFIDLNERGIEYNLANMGYTICHEMSHSLDDWGSKYDYKGNLHDWWSPEDKKKFKIKQNDVIKQYEEFAARDKIKFDASIGVGEDLADISGMAISSYYLRDFQELNKLPYPVRKLSFQLFYTLFAMQQRQQINKKSLRAQLKTNPHPLDKYRCNIPLSRNSIFRALFDIVKGDGMWWHNTDSIW